MTFDASRYGPFWIATTLIFVMAAAGNFANYIQFDDKEKAWAYDFTKVTVAASCLYSIISLVPLVVWFFLDKVGTTKGLVEVISLYGYSLFVFVPTSVSEWVMFIFPSLALAELPLDYHRL